MNFSRVLAIVALASAASAAEIPAGTHLLLRVESSVSSRTAKPGDGVHLRTATPISAGSKIVIPIGSYAQGVVTHAKRSGRNHVPGELQIQLVTLMLSDGEVFKTSPRTTSMEPESSVARTQQKWNGKRLSPVPGGLLGLTLAGAIVGGRTGAGVGLAAGAAAVLIPALVARGKDVELHQGAAVDVVFDTPAALE